MQLELIHTLQHIRCNLIDLFFIGLNFFDTNIFFFLLIPALWFGKSWKAGLKLFSILLLSSFLVQKLKMFFCLPRPFHLIPNLGIIQVPGHGFPSGGATNAMLLSCLLLSYGKIHFKKTIALSFLFFVSLSRIYLGVHFITDVLAGWVLGLFLWAIFISLSSPVEKWLKKRSSLSLLFLSLAFPFCLFLLNPSMRSISFIAMGLNTSLFILRPKTTKTDQQALLKGGLGAFTSFLFYLITSYFFHPETTVQKTTVSFSLGLGIGILGAYLCNNIPFERLKKRKI